MNLLSGEKILLDSKQVQNRWMKKGIKEKWNLTSIPNRGIGVEGDFNFEACPNDVLEKKKDEEKKKEEWKKKQVGRKRGIKENLVQTKSQLYIYIYVYIAYSAGILYSLESFLCRIFALVNLSSFSA